jgi:oxygen-dependent protoporphyrinogen oxidase
LVDALVGSIYATDTHHASLAAAPQLAELTSGSRSLLLGARRARRRAAAASAASAAAGSLFDAPLAGMGALVAAAGRYVAEHGGRIHTGRGVDALEAGDGGWIADGERFDAVVLAVPARSAATALKAVAPEAAEGLATFEQADVILVRVHYSGDDLPVGFGAGQSGYLVPKSRQRFVTAVSFGSQKWAHWRQPDGSQIMRVSLGRDGLPVADLDDAAVIDAVEREFWDHFRIAHPPTEVAITRWVGGFPQYRPHHLARVAAVDGAVPGGIHLTGASYRGIGIPACIADGERAASQAIDRLRR